MQNLNEAPHQPICALVVDDDDVDRERLARLLSKYSRPIEVAESASKSEALQALQGRALDPDWDGATSFDTK